jgi:hypothetical protein
MLCLENASPGLMGSVGEKAWFKSKVKIKNLVSKISVTKL